MSDRSKAILDSAIDLSPEERAEIADALLASLETDADELASDAAIAKEALRRLEGFRNGSIEAQDGDEVMRELLAKHQK